MSRSGYVDDCEGWDLIRWRGAVASAIKGARGKKLLTDMAAALDAMPEKRLIKESLESPEGVCALGCLGKAKGIDMTPIDPTDRDQVAKVFDIAPALAAEIAFINDDAYHVSPEERWVYVRRWVNEQLGISQ